MAEIPDKSDARITFWSYDDCAIKYEKFGQQKITYTIWKAALSNKSIIKGVSKDPAVGDSQMKS